MLFPHALTCTSLGSGSAGIVFEGARTNESEFRNSQD